MLGVGVDMADDVDDAVGVSPFHKIDAHTGILFTAAARENHAEIPGLACASGPRRQAWAQTPQPMHVATLRTGRFLSLRRASTESCLYFSMQALQSRRIELKLGHADNEIVHADLAAVVESARESDFDVKSLGKMAFSMRSMIFLHIVITNRFLFYSYNTTNELFKLWLPRHILKKSHYAYINKS